MPDSDPHKPCPRELTQQTSESPGTVKDSETLAHSAFHESHINPSTGGFSTGAFSVGDVYERDGISVDRLTHCDEDEIVRRGNKHVAHRSDRHRFFGFGVALAGDIRKICMEGGKRSLCVIDDAVPGNAAHALMTPSGDLLHDASGRKLDEKRFRAKFKIVRDQLIDIFNPIRQPGEN